MSFITSNQLLAHLIGDFFLQNDYMAVNKKDKIFPCLVHSITYALPFLFITLSPFALLFIMATHFAIDHFGLPRYFIWARNQVTPKDSRKSWKECNLTGFSPDRPIWLALWLMIIVDNTLHLILNAVAIKWL